MSLSQRLPLLVPVMNVCRLMRHISHNRLLVLRDGTTSRHTLHAVLCRDAAQAAVQGVHGRCQVLVVLLREVVKLRAQGQVGIALHKPAQRCQAERSHFHPLVVPGYSDTTHAQFKA